MQRGTNDVSAPHLHTQPVLQVLHGDDDHRMLDIIVEEHVLQVGVIVIVGGVIEHKFLARAQ
jgi:hypothetical protein